jgi:hypothetical protein
VNHSLGYFLKINISFGQNKISTYEPQVGFYHNKNFCPLAEGDENGTRRFQSFMLTKRAPFKE